MERVKWEYKILRVKNIGEGEVVKEAREALDIYGEEGWELVSVDTPTDPNGKGKWDWNSWTVLYLKRPKNV